MESLFRRDGKAIRELGYYDPILKTNLPVYIQLNKLNTADNYCGVSLQNSIN
jgi:ribosomal protein S16